MPPTTADIPLPRSLCANRNAHPGVADLPRPKRTHEEVQAEKTAKESKLASRSLLRSRTIETTALLEEKMRQDHNEKIKTASNPPRTQMTKFVRPTTEIPGANNPSENENGKDNLLPQELSSDSGDSWGQSKEAMEASDDEDDRDMDVESEDGLPGTVKKRPVGKRSKGELRSAVVAAQKPVQVTGHKQQQSSQSKPNRKRNKHSVVSTGFHSNWEERLQDVDPAAVSKSQSQMPNQGDDDESEGGITDNGGEIAERKLLDLETDTNVRQNIPAQYFGGKSKASTTTKASRVAPVAKIVATTSIAEFVDAGTRTRITSSRIKKEEIRLGHLPSQIQGTFETVFVPRARDIFGYTHPWTTPDKTIIQELWIKCFPMNGGGPDAVADKLLEDRVHGWRNKFAKAALTFLQNEIFPKLPDNSKTQRAEWCTWATSNEAHNHPFYYQTYEEDDEGNAIKCSGIFQSSIVSAVLGTHFSSISSIPMEERAIQRPVGALVMALQAIKRAISMYTTGEKVEQPRPMNDFSKNNWGDNIEIREGRTVHILTTTKLVQVASKLKDKQWEKIIRAAMQASKGKKAVQPAPSSDPPMVPEDDFEIVDHDSDLGEEK